MHYHSLLFQQNLRRLVSFAPDSLLLNTFATCRSSSFELQHPTPCGLLPRNFCSCDHKASQRTKLTRWAEGERDAKVPCGRLFKLHRVRYKETRRQSKERRCGRRDYVWHA
eukprot:511807-Pleurochrysis_carterae.AAC.1